jgi:acyl carrier protein
MWNPFVGKANHIHDDLCEQLESRDKNDLCIWKEFSDEIQEQAKDISEILITHLGWPKSSVFIPNDPAEIILWDRTGDLDSIEAVISIEKEIGITMPDEFWEDLSGISFVGLLEILNKKAAEPEP